MCLLQGMMICDCWAWISILEADYIIFLLQPHFRNFNKRIIKTPKLYFYDTGLACNLFSVQILEQLGIHSMRGAIFESFIVSELLKSRFNQGLQSNLYYWRDRSGNEIDVLVEKGEKLQPIEIKSGKTLNADYFKGLKKWIDFAGNTAVDPLLIYGGDSSQTRSGIRVLSWNDRGIMDIAIS